MASLLSSLSLGFFDNRKVFGLPSVVQAYGAAAELQKPESVILDRLQPRLAAMRMLDIGVGAGRTTPHFAPKVREYLGIDYAPSMVDYCRERFSGSPGHPVFRCYDARELQSLGEGRFDFVLFSYNGLDFVSHADRVNILCQIRNLLNPGGAFCFSSHNLYALTRHWDFLPGGKASRSWREFATRTAFFLLHGPARFLERKDFAVVRDGAKAFRIRNYCVKPEAQLRQLAEAGFRNTTVFSLDAGAEIRPSGDWTALPDRWLYYLCEA